MIKILIPVMSLFTTFTVTPQVIDDPVVIEIVDEVKVEESDVEIEEVYNNLPKEHIFSDNSGIYCSCIRTAREAGAKIPMNTNASDLSPNSDIPVVGGLILMKYPQSYHVAYIESITEDGVYVIEGNRIPCKKERRFIESDFYAITGYWVPDNEDGENSV